MRKRTKQSGPKVDIITVAYGKVDFLVGLYKTLQDYDAGVRYNWIIVDNHSPNPETLKPFYDLVETKENIKVIKSPKNLGFSGGNNLGFEKSSASQILLLNSDIRIKHAGWLKTMTDELDNSEATGIVGAKLLFFEGDGLTGLAKADPARPPGKIQHAGVAFNIIGQPYHIYNGWNSDNPRVNTRREMNAVTGACLLTRSSLYESLDGLDDIYGVGNFEDVEYCLRCRAKSYKVVYQPKACLYHYAGGSNNTAAARMNEQIFQLRCKSIIEYDEYRYY